MGWAERADDPGRGTEFRAPFTGAMPSPIVGAIANHISSAGIHICAKKVFGSTFPCMHNRS